jgi:SM-20-related protein
MGVVRVDASSQALRPSRVWDDILAYDDVLDLEEQGRLFAFLKLPGWAFGAFSESGANPSRYWYKHFGGVVRDGREALDSVAFEREIESNAPLVAAMWKKLQARVLVGHALTRCYANGYPLGAEGGVHFDSNISSHFTAIYYPHLQWSPNYAGETVFFEKDGGDMLASVYPKPNRLVVFPGTIPHAARPITRSCPELRITLMFKTVGPSEAPSTVADA